MTLKVIPPAGRHALISLVYDATGLIRVNLIDNQLLGWVADDAFVLKPVPVVVGSLAPMPPGTGAVLSPRWALASSYGVEIEDNSVSGGPPAWRGSFQEFFDYMAFNNGANRKLDPYLLNGLLVKEFNAWSGINPANLWPRSFDAAA